MTLDWSTDEKAIMAGADKLLAIALEFNSVSELEGTACCSVFHALRVTIGIIYDDPSAFVDECLRFGITCSENAAARYKEFCQNKENF